MRALEPCPCGALDCPRCGPLQGSVRCAPHRRLACGKCEDVTTEHELLMHLKSVIREATARIGDSDMEWNGTVEVAEDAIARAEARHG